MSRRKAVCPRLFFQFQANYSTSQPVVSANDSVEPFLLQELKIQGGKLDHDALIVGKQMEEYFPGGYLTVNDDQTLANIVEKPEPQNTPSDLVNIVYHMFQKPDQFQDLIKQIKSGIESDDVYEQALAELIKSGGQIKVPLTRPVASCQISMARLR